MHGAPHEVGGFGVLALLVAQHAQQVQRVDVRGIAGERRSIVAFGVVEAAVTMGREGAVKYSVHDGGWFWVRQTPHFPTLGCRPPN